MTTGIPQRVHLVGIGGAHMSAIGRILLSWGHDVSGSDLRATPVTDTMQPLWARRGHRAAQGRERRRRRARRDDLRRDRRQPGAGGGARVAASPAQARRHGREADGGQDRASVSPDATARARPPASIASILAGAGRDPTYLIGAEVPGLGTNAAAGNGRARRRRSRRVRPRLPELPPRCRRRHQRRGRPPRLLQDVGGRAGGLPAVRLAGEARRHAHPLRRQRRGPEPA